MGKKKQSSSRDFVPAMLKHLARARMTDFEMADAVGVCENCAWDWMTSLYEAGILDRAPRPKEVTKRGRAVFEYWVSSAWGGRSA